MESVYDVLWTDHALEELRGTIHYLRSNFSKTEIDHLVNNIESVLSSISRYPELYPASSQQGGVRRAVVAKYNTLHYRINTEKNQIEILSFFSNRTNPDRLEF